MKFCDILTDQQLAIFALLVIVALTVSFGIDGAKDLLQMVAGGIIGWMSKSEGK